MCARIAGIHLLIVVAFACPARAAGTADVVAESIRIEIPPAGLHQEVHLRDGSQHVGRVVSIAADAIVFRTLAGTDLTIPRSEITYLERVKGEKLEGNPPGGDPGGTRLLFGPTGRSLQKGHGYAGVYGLFVPFVQVGLTDRISIGAGTPIIFWGSGEPPFWVTPKVQLVAGKKVQVAAGVIQFVNLADATGGLAYSVMTYGSTESAVTVGGGYGYAVDEGSTAGTVVVIVGGERRMSARTKLIGEAYLFGADTGLASLGVRLLGRRVSADLGVLVPVGSYGAGVAPMVNLAWGF